jgi:hypothetical protein
MKIIISLAILLLLLFGCKVDHKISVAIIHDMKIAIPLWDSCLAKDSSPILNAKNATYFVTCHAYPGESDNQFIGSPQKNHAWATGFIHDIRNVIPAWDKCHNKGKMPTLHHSNHVHYIECWEHPGD